MTQLSGFPDIVPVNLAIVQVADSRHVYSKWYQDPKNTFWIPDGGSLSKKKELQAEKDTERNNLDNGLKGTRTKIQQLSRQIQELQNQEVTLNNQLLAIDQKYDSKFTDLERKIQAIRDAKEQVVVSIVDIEAGIKSNLS